MEIEVGQFRNLHNRTFVFHEGLNLLSGNNGKGKSNILACIEWVLYGSCQGGSVLPRGGKKKASAKITFPQKKLVIERRKGPELLLLRKRSDEGKEGGGKEEEEYKDKEASELINAYFGSPEVWRATCFVPQESRCPLLSGTKEQQINTLNSLIFSNSDPSLIQKKIDGKRKEEEQEVKVLKGKIEGLTQGLSLEGLFPEGEEMTSDKIKMFILFLQQQQKELEDWERKRFQLNTQRFTLQKNLEEIEQELSSSSLSPSGEKGEKGEGELEKLEKEIEQMKAILPQLQMIEQFQQKLSLLENELNTLPPLPSFAPVEKLREKGEEELNRIKIQEFQYEENSKKCQRLGIKYEEEVIEAQKTFLRRVLEIIPEVKERQQKRKEIQRLTLLLTEEEKFKENKSNQVMELEREIFQHEKNKDTLQCPSCHQALIYQSSSHSLHPSDGFVVDGKHLEQMKFQLIQVKMHEKKRKELEIYRKELDEKLASFSPSSDEEEGLVEKEGLFREQWYGLENIKVVEKPVYSSNEYQQFLKRIRIEQELQEWKQKTEGFPSSTISSKHVEEELRKNEQLYREGNLLLLKKNELKKRKKKVEEQLSGIEVMENKEKELENGKQGLYNLQEKYERMRLSEEMAEKKKVLDGYKEMAEKKQERVSKIEVLKDICRKVQSERIDFSLYSLNMVTNEILKEMFEEPISLEIKATKETKQGKVKNELSLIIDHNHEILTCLRPDLSVGQANRVSMALSFALFLLTPCPFILLDEPFAPVDKEWIDYTLSAIKDCLPNGRTCIITAHDPNGLYDHEVHLS